MVTTCGRCGAVTTPDALTCAACGALLSAYAPAAGSAAAARDAIPGAGLASHPDPPGRGAGPFSAPGPAAWAVPTRDAEAGPMITSITSGAEPDPATSSLPARHGVTGDAREAGEDAGGDERLLVSGGDGGPTGNRPAPWAIPPGTARHGGAGAMPAGVWSANAATSNLAGDSHPAQGGGDRSEAQASLVEVLGQRPMSGAHPPRRAGGETGQVTTPSRPGEPAGPGREATGQAGGWPTITVTRTVAGSGSRRAAPLNPASPDSDLGRSPIRSGPGQVTRNLATWGAFAVGLGCILLVALRDVPGWISLCIGPLTIVAVLVVATLVLNDRAAK